MQARLWPRNDAERAVAAAKNIDVSRVYGLNDLVSSDNCFFAATGITDGELLRGVHYLGAGGASTESLVMRSRTGTVRRIQATHRVEKMRQFGLLGWGAGTVSEGFPCHSARSGP
jgi:fructose-1,6-bisphosphatase II